MTVVVEIQNMDKLQKALRDYEGIAHPILQKAVAATNAIFARHTLKQNPVPYRTGFLLASFKHKLGNLEATWKPTVFYAPFVEFGTSKMASRPYMRQILEASKGEINDTFEQALDQITEKIAG